MDKGTWQEGRLRRKCEACLRLRQYKSPGVPLSEIPPQRHQPRLFLCYYTANKLLYGTRCLRPAVRPVRKPGLTLSWVCRESSGAPVRSLELPAVKELWSQKLKSLALGEWLSESLLNGQTGSWMSLLNGQTITQPKPFYDSLTSLQTPKQLKTSKVQTRNRYITTAAPFLFKHWDSLYLYKIQILSLHQHQTHLQITDLSSLPRCSLKLLLPLFQGLLT